MSASREKKNRQNRASDFSEPKTAWEAQHRKEERRASILYAVIAVAFVLVAIIGIVWRSNVIPKHATAVTINGEKYTAGEVDFYYQSAYQQFLSNYYYYLSYLGVDTNSSLKSQTISSIGPMFVPDAVEGETWHDYVMEKAIQQMITTQAMTDAAEAEGFAWTDELQAELDESIASIQTNYGMTTKEYLQQMYGGILSEESFLELMKDAMLSNAYVTAYQDSLTYSEEDLENAYAEDPNSYDVVSYELVTVSGSVPTTDADGNTVEVTDEMKETAMAEAKATADSLFESAQAGSSLESLADGSDAASYSQSDEASYSSTSAVSSVVADWLFDSARTAGDTAVLEDTASSAYYVVSFGSRGRYDYHTVDVRHILIQVDESDLDTESDTYDADLQARKDAALAEAEDLLAQWKAGEATEDSFAALANENSDDGGSNTNGGLYQQVAKGQMVENFDAWCFDPARAPGDTGIVYGESANYKGYHVMYYVGENIPYWQVQVTSTLVSEDLTAWHAEKIAPYAAEEHSFALKFVG